MSAKYDLVCEPRGFQHCFIDLTIAKQLNVTYKDFCRIETSKLLSCICSVRLQPQAALSTGTLIAYDNTVYVNKPQSNFNSIIQKLNVYKSETPVIIDVTVIFPTLEDVLKQHRRRSKLTSALKLVLTDFGVIKNCTVKCTHLPISTIFSVKKIFINSISNLPDENHVVIIEESTEIKIDKLVSEEEFDSKNQRNNLGGLDNCLNTLKQQLILQMSLENIGKLKILYGPSGTGKTSLITKLADDLNMRLLHIDCGSVFQKSTSECEGKLKSYFQTAIELSKIDPCLLFLDQIDSICSIQRANSNNGKRLIAQLRLLIDSIKNQPRLSIIAATNKIDSIESSLRHSEYFAEEILVGIPNCNQREEILSAIIDKPNIDLHLLAQSSPGYTGADLLCLCQRIDNEAELNTDSFLNAIKTSKPTSKRINAELQPESTGIRWDDIGGLDETKYQIRQTLDLQLNKPQLLEHYGLPKPKGILLYGPPGCCKTTLVKAAANDLKVNFIAITPSDIYSPYLGESEKAISGIFRKARSNSPTILFIDELDAFVGSRIQNEQNTVHVRVLSTLLNEMDGIGVKTQEILTHSYSKTDGGVLVMAATNRPDLIDPALLRPGRFDAMIYLPQPDKEARKSILRVCMKNLKTRDVDQDDLAEKTELFSGADLENLCREAGYMAIKTDGIDVDAITQHHFNLALAETTPSLTHEQIQFYNDFH